MTCVPRSPSTPLLRREAMSEVGAFAMGVVLATVALGVVWFLVAV